MFFTIMNKDRAPLVERGYILSEEHETIIDDKIFDAVVKEKGKEYADSIIENFGDCEAICLGEDGVFYTVLFEDVSVDGDGPMPCAVAWHEIEVILGKK